MVESNVERSELCVNLSIVPRHFQQVIAPWVEEILTLPLVETARYSYCLLSLGTSNK